MLLLMLMLMLLLMLMLMLLVLLLLGSANFSKACIRTVGFREKSFKTKVYSGKPVTLSFSAIITIIAAGLKDDGFYSYGGRLRLKVRIQ